MRGTLCASAAAAAAIVLSSFTAMAQERRDQTAKPAAETRSTASQEAIDFINQMTIVGMTEVQLGKVAAERATNANVKSFGQMMVRDHSKAGKDLEGVAATLGVKPTTELDQKHSELVARLSKLQGAEFDRQYIEAMAQGHDEVESQVHERAASAGLSPQSEQPLTQWAARTLPTVRTHLKRAQELQSQLAK